MFSDPQGTRELCLYFLFLFSDPQGTRELCLYWTVSVLRSSEDQGALSLLECVCFPILMGPGSFVFIGLCLFYDPQRTRELCHYWTVSVFRSSWDQVALSLLDFVCFPILRGPGSFVFIGLCMFSDPQGTMELCLYFSSSVFRSSWDQGALSLLDCVCFTILRGPWSFVFIGLCLFSDPQGTR